jgi:hypothetical protein
MVPTSQIRAVDPHSSYNSDNVNRITRIVTSGNDAISRDTLLQPSKNTTTSIKITAGICVKDDVMIQLENDEYIDITDDTNFVEGSKFTGAEQGYIVLVYQYIKQPIPPTCQLLVLKTKANFDSNTMLFLGVVNMLSATVIDTIELSDPGIQERVVLNFSETYTDDKARAADAYNPITNHAAAQGADKNKIIGTDSSSGDIIYIPLSEFGHNVVEIDTGDYVGGYATITHNIGVYPGGVQVLDYTTKEVIIPAELIHIDSNSFKVSFDEFDPTPHIYVIFP